jgi:hypothetical protein
MPETWTPLDGIGRPVAELAEPQDAERAERRAQELNRVTLDRESGQLVRWNGEVLTDPRRG